MIDKNKQYRTRDGREVRIYATDGFGEFYVHGAVRNTRGGWEPRNWPGDGRIEVKDCPLDLIEVKPRIKREVWVNVYRHDDGYEFATYHDNEIDAESEQGDAMIARARLTIDCAEGEGL